MRALKLLVREQGRLMPMPGATPLFGIAGDMRFPDAWVQCGSFRRLHMADIFEQQDMHTHLPDVVEQTDRLFPKKHAFKAAGFGAMRREEVASKSIDPANRAATSTARRICSS